MGLRLVIVVLAVTCWSCQAANLKDASDVWKRMYAKRQQTTEVLTAVATEFSNTGEIRSPNFPDNYPVDTERAWRVISSMRPRKTLSILIKAFNLEFGQSCEFDYVAIYDGADENAPLVEKFCGTAGEGFYYQTTSNEVFIKFQSDYSVTEAGFAITWMITGSEYYLVMPVTAPGMISSSNYPNASYYNDERRGWAISAPDSMVVHLHFVSFDVEGTQGTECEFDEFLVYDGPSVFDPVSSFCGAGPLEDIISSGKDMLLVFSSDTIIPKSGFNIQVQFRPTPTRPATTTTRPTTTTATRRTTRTTPITTTTTRRTTHTTTTATSTTTRRPSACPGPAILTESGIIESPNFGNGDYGNNEFCQWRISAPQGQWINVRFTDFNLEFDLLCGFDNLTIYNGPDTSAPFFDRVCGPDLPGPYTFTLGDVVLVFATDGSVTSTGFRIEVTMSNPGNPEPVPVEFPTRMLQDETKTARRSQQAKKHYMRGVSGKDSKSSARRALIRELQHLLSKEKRSFH